MRGQIFEMILNTSGPAKNQLIEIMCCISRFGWPKLIDKLINALNSDDVIVVSCTLHVAHSILKFWYAENTDNLENVLTFVLDRCAQPLIELSIKILSYKNNKPTLNVLYKSTTLVLKILSSLITPNLLQFIQTNMDIWMNILHILIGHEDPESHMLHGIHAQVCHLLRLYAENYSEHFFLYSKGFVEDICKLLLKTSPDVKHDLVKK